jgi:hypothetical protein
MSDVVSLEAIRARRQAAIAAIGTRHEASPDELNDAFDVAFDRVLAVFVRELERELKRLS